MRGRYGKSVPVDFFQEWRSQKKYAGGGIFLDQGIHMLDLMQLFCGEFEEVKSFISNKHWQHDVEDNAFNKVPQRTPRLVISLLIATAFLVLSSAVLVSLINVPLVWSLIIFI